MKTFQRHILPVLVTGGIILALWYGLKAAFDLQRFTLPYPREIIAAAWEQRALLTSGAWMTFQSAVIGFLLACGGGFILAVAMATARPLRAGLYPYVTLLQLMPIVVLAPIIIIWAKPGLGSIVIITFLICFFPIVVNTTQGLLSTDRGMTDLMRTYQASRWQTLRMVRIPAALPYFFASLRIAGTLAVIGAIVGEFFAGTANRDTGGLGFLVVVYNSQVKIPALYAAAFAGCLLGLLFMGLVVSLNWFFLRKWHESIGTG